MSSEFNLSLETLADLGCVAASSWNALGDGNPFLRHEFLCALETSGSVGPETAWQPSHLIVTDPQRGLLGAMPLYVKYDSRGEFVFDWSWADAFARAGRNYYPKLVAAVPFTPATGPRLLIHPQAERNAVARCLLSGMTELAERTRASSIHVLFPHKADGALLAASGYLARKSCQFHWTNDGYASFDDFLARFTSAKRKKVRRERRRIAEADVRFEHLAGNEPSRADWDAIYEFYSRTFLRRGRPPYLNRAFFASVAASMPENLVILLARFHGEPIAAAICFRSQDTLYGRYWGSLADFHSLHFETCYYQGIEYCIRNGLDTFEPGTQGEHKVSRGFSPTATWSYHRMVDPAFHAAIDEFLDRETNYVDEYMSDVDDHVPYRRTGL
jgi:predicted N-acyltransferase